MVNIFHSYIFSCIFTTAILYFLQIYYVNAVENSCDMQSPFYECMDGKRHTIENKLYYLKNFWRRFNVHSPIAALYVEKNGTVVDASHITIWGNHPYMVSSYGGYVKDGGKLILEDSNFKDIPALRSQNGVISMKGGSIKGISHAIYASGEEADVELVSVNVEIVPDNLKKERSIVSDSGAMVRMSESTVTLNEVGPLLTKLGGRYLLDTMEIKGKGKEKLFSDNTDMIEVFEVFQSGDIHLRDSSIQSNDMHGFLIKNFSGSADDNGKLLQNYGSLDNFKKTDIRIERSNISILGKGVRGLSFYALSPEKTAKILDIDNKTSSETKRTVTGTASVHLSKTVFKVPDGIAIYAKGSDGYKAEAILELSDGTEISGDLLLKGENNSFLSVKASASSLTGAVHIEDESTAHLHLARGSTWFLKPREYKDFKYLKEQSGTTISSVSSVHLSDSTLIFDQDLNKDQDPYDSYQTLLIGKKTDAAPMGKVYSYSAKGNAHIKLNAILNDDGLFYPNKNDRILIYGNVFGTTFVHIQNMEKFLETSDSVKKLSYGGVSSISLIQVSGTAQEDSFKLAHDYITVGGFPYQYRLFAYGPSSSLGKADADNRLVEGEEEFWDFRLEGVYINPDSPKISSPSSSSIRSVSLSRSRSSASDGASTEDHSPSVSSDLAESLPAGSTPVLPIPLMPP
ncbi:hypothetical protein ABID39_001613, partial [Bartonella japonica]